MVKNFEFLDIPATGMHAIITGCSCVISMDLTVCHKQIEEKWRQQIIVMAEHEFAVIMYLVYNSCILVALDLPCY